jgi:hypothetical protein
MTIGLTYEELKALKPCANDFAAVVAALGGAEAWNGKSIDAASARAAGVTLEQMVWVASAVARTDPDVKRRLRLWMADCAARVLHIYESTEKSDAPRKAIIAARQFARGGIGAAAWEAARAAAWEAAKVAADHAAWAVAKVAAGDAASAAAWDATRNWQYERLVAWLSADEPQDWPLPARKEEIAA